MLLPNKIQVSLVLQCCTIIAPNCPNDYFLGLISFSFIVWLGVFHRSACPCSDGTGQISKVRYFQLLFVFSFQLLLPFVTINYFEAHWQLDSLIWTAAFILFFHALQHCVYCSPFGTKNKGVLCCFDVGNH